MDLQNIQDQLNTEFA